MRCCFSGVVALSCLVLRSLAAGLMHPTYSKPLLCFGPRFYLAKPFYYFAFHYSICTSEYILIIGRQAQTSTMAIQLATENPPPDKMGNTIPGMDAR